jgi:hypothetical protein
MLRILMTMQKRRWFGALAVSLCLAGTLNLKASPSTAELTVASILPDLQRRAQQQEAQASPLALKALKGLERPSALADARLFGDVVATKNDAFEAFQLGVKNGDLDPAATEYFCHIYKVADPGVPSSPFFHSQWLPARFIKADHQLEQYEVVNALAQDPAIETYSLMHSHSTNARYGLTPSMLDVAVASTYQDADGRFRYLYLINSNNRLIQFKAVRPTDPHRLGALSAMRAVPKMNQDYLN